jgi:hypothetical protein
MKHWLKRALATAALASGAMIATAGMASASSESPLPVDPEAIISLTQEATNTNETNQNAEPSAETNQVNVYAPVAVLSKDSNNGKVDQSNEAETTVVAVNENGTEQSIDQDQTAGDDRGGCGKCGSEGDVSQTQTAENNNETNQTANPSATTNQSNEIRSDHGQPGASKEWNGHGRPGENGGTDQSNEAETTVVAVNENGTEQSIDQDQTADGRDRCGKCGSEGDVSQTQTAENNNETNQTANPSATTNQSNQIGSDPAEASSPTWNKGYESNRDRNGTEQSNEAETTVIAVNENGTEQSIDQGQTARDKDDRDHKDKDDRDHKDKDDRDHKDKDDRDHKDKDDRDHKDKDCLGADCDRCVRTQSQTAGNNNTSNQTANPSAETNQSNSADGGQDDVDQSNEARTKALAANRNGTGQSIGQSQHLSS